MHIGNTPLTFAIGFWIICFDISRYKTLAKVAFFIRSMCKCDFVASMTIIAKHYNLVVNFWQNITLGIMLVFPSYF